MAEKKMVSVRLHTDTKKRIENYAEEHEISQSDAIRRLLEKGADLEEAGLTVAASTGSSSGSESESEKEVMADGGQVVRPMFNLLGAFYALISLSLFAIIGLAAFNIFRVSFLNYTQLAEIMMSSLLLIAPIMVFLYTDYPEKIDRLLYSGVRRVSRITEFTRGEPQ